MPIKILEVVNVQVKFTPFAGDNYASGVSKSKAADSIPIPKTQQEIEILRKANYYNADACKDFTSNRSSFEKMLDKLQKGLLPKDELDNTLSALADKHTKPEMSEHEKTKVLYSVYSETSFTNQIMLFKQRKKEAIEKNLEPNTYCPEWFPTSLKETSSKISAWAEGYAKNAGYSVTCDPADGMDWDSFREKEYQIQENAYLQNINQRNSLDFKC